MINPRRPFTHCNGYFQSIKNHVIFMLNDMFVQSCWDANSLRQVDIKQVEINYCTKRLTAPYTPDQNEVTYPTGLWTELVNTAVYILNRTGKSSVDGVSPYELWNVKKPRTKHLRVIGHVMSLSLVKSEEKWKEKLLKRYLDWKGSKRYFVNLKRNLDDNEHIKLPFQKVKPEEETDNDKSQYYILELQEEGLGARLRDRSTLKKPQSLNRCILTIESVVKTSEVPQTYKDAIKHHDCFKWKRAMDEEIDSLKETKTWKLEDLPKGAKAIPCKWVFKLKSNADGSIEKYKARLSEADPCSYVRSEHGRELFIVLYVNDGSVAATNHMDLEFFLK
ncbi:uncharacterized protein LOC143196352 [Rhynchophorus ferrugineus]|uniref:uncharacterized protein LOC143196352 n=1 Tax=Rhynchophorus ferrugineus TaxID=354439 RepID=UPI003FCCF675